MHIDALVHIENLAPINHAEKEEAQCFIYNIYKDILGSDHGCRKIVQSGGGGGGCTFSRNC